MAQGVRARPETQEPLMAVIERLDPEVVLVGLLGGVAAAGGIIPPFTRLMSTFGGISADFVDLSNKVGPANLLMGASPPLALYALLTNKPADSAAAESVTVDPARYALIASGVLEAMMMMTLMKNPGFIELLGKGLDKISLP